VSDLGSAFGTLVNGDPIEGSRVLRSGDRIVMGKDHVTVFYFDAEADFPAAVREAQTARLEKSISDLATNLPGGLSDLEKISFILDFQYQWGQSFTPEKTFQQILESALTISGAERGFILVRRNDRYEYAAGMNRRGRPLALKDFHASQSVVAQVVAEGNPVLMAEGIRGKFAEQQSIVAMRLGAVACLPLYGIPSQGDAPALLGILYLDSTKLMHALKALDEKILNKLAEEAGHVLEQVEVLKTLEERRKLEQELSLAQETQKSLLPRSLPEYENFRVCAFSKPTRHVGGDLYDFATPESGDLLGVLADVAGKGLSAALLSSMIIGCLDMQLRAGVKPAHALNQ
ncbi:MAG: GAF domain-containing protein, partial [Terriglobia bacterium]